MAIIEVAAERRIGEIVVTDENKWWLAMGILLRLNGGDKGGEDADPLLAIVNDKIGHNWQGRIGDVHEADALILVEEANKKSI